VKNIYVLLVRLRSTYIGRKQHLDGTMRVSRAQAEENRRNVVKTAARLFRERGFDGVGLAQVMSEAGLTQGGFYKQFKSKDDLVVQACESALCAGAEHMARVAGAAETDPFAAIVASYLSPGHRDGASGGCAFAALGADAARRSADVGPTFEAGLIDHLVVLERAIQDSPRCCSKDPIAAFATMVGAMLLSRVVADSRLSQKILEAAPRSLLTPSDESGSNSS
jgi:TetR/AcrR family transcriptional repressor of nem operon